MTIRHLPGLNRDKWYVMSLDRSDGDVPPWHHRGYWLHWPKGEAHMEYSLFRYNFGVGFEFGRNGGESDLGMDFHIGKLASVYLRIGAPWLHWARVRPDKEERYSARHTGVSVGGGDGNLVRVKFEDIDGVWTKGQPWWRSWRLSTTTIVGRDDCETVKNELDRVMIPMPEGAYWAQATEEVRTWRYRRFPGTLRDLAKGPRSRRSVRLDIEGGIPVEGKGENSWDCGMDGLFGCGGSDVPDAIASAVRSVLRDRKRYGGPHNLTRATTVAEASGAA